MVPGQERSRSRPGLVLTSWWPWASYLASLSLHFPSLKWGLHGFQIWGSVVDWVNTCKAPGTRSGTDQMLLLLLLLLLCCCLWLCDFPSFVMGVGHPRDLGMCSQKCCVPAVAWLCSGCVSLESHWISLSPHFFLCEIGLVICTS